MRLKKNGKHIERYEIDRSPFAMRPTQRDIAALLKETRDDLRRLVNYKEQFIRRGQTEPDKKGKVRNLAYPVGRLRAVHERLKFHLNKVRLPSYLFSPRKNRGQRDNAALHLDQNQYLTLDLKQFYPSTSSGMVKRWLRDELGMAEDVAGLVTHLATVDERVSFGSPATPVICSLVHRPMFDAIADLCTSRGLRYSVWVDDLTISGQFIPSEILEQIREIIRSTGLKSHKIRYRTGSRTVFITGIGVVGARLVAPNSLNLRIKECWEAYHSASTEIELDDATQRLLSNLGTIRHIAGPKTEMGMRAANEMNSLRQKLAKARKAAELLRKQEREARAHVANSEATDAPF